MRRLIDVFVNLYVIGILAVLLNRNPYQFRGLGKSS